MELGSDATAVTRNRCPSGEPWSIPEKVAGPNVADRYLAAVARVHVHAKKPSDDHPETLRIRLGIDRGACEDVGQPAAGREKLHRLARQ